MNTKTTTILFLVLTALTVLTGIILYPQFPDQIASHWNAAGEVDGYTDKFWGIFLFPAFMVLFFLLYVVIPKIDPLKSNIESFRPQYNLLWLGLAVYFVYIFGLAMAWNLGHRFDFVVVMIPAMAILFYLIGSVLEKSKRNWFMGIRTPWTLSSDVVWDKTHRFGGRMFKLAAVVSLLGMFVDSTIAIWLSIAPILVVSVVTVIYSYTAYRQE